MRKPVIGVMPLWDTQKESIWMLPGYLEGIAQGGGIGIVLPLGCDRRDVEQLVERCDGFLFTGGHDVDPALYQETKQPYCQEICPERDRLEGWVLQEALGQDKPVFGICRGLQFLNVATGGSLYQDIPAQRAGTDSDFHNQAPPYSRGVHRVFVERDSPLHTILGKEEIVVNSLHHQAIKELSPKLRAAAISEDGMIEAAFMCEKKFVLGVQWHPEYNYNTDEGSAKLFSAFVAACR